MISRSILASASILKKWHTEHITSTRSCEGSLKWLKDQVVEGKFFGCLIEMWRALTSHVHLQKAGFVCSADEAKSRMWVLICSLRLQLLRNTSRWHRIFCNRTCQFFFPIGPLIDLSKNKNQNRIENQYRSKYFKIPYVWIGYIS